MERGLQKNKKEEKKSRPRRQRNRALFGRPVTCELSHTLPAACLRDDETVCACFFNQNDACSRTNQREETHGKFLYAIYQRENFFYTSITYFRFDVVI